MNKCINFKIGKKNTKRLFDYINSERFIQNKTITEHWSKRKKGNEESFAINDDEILFYPNFNNGLSYNYANYLFKENVYYKKFNLKLNIKKFILNILKINYADNFSPKKYFNDYWSESSNLKYPQNKIIEEFGNHDDYIIYNAAWFYNEIRNFYQKKINSKNEPISCIEIGPGAGNLIRIMLSEQFLSHATIVDLPSSIVFSFCNLIKRFPNIDYLLPNEITDRVDFNNYKLLFLTNSQLDLVPNNFYSLGVNTMSFGEMNNKTINGYFQLLRHSLIKNNLFYCLNRVEKIMKTNNQTEIVKFSEYPWNSKDNDLHYQISFIEKFRNFNPMFLKVTNLSR